MLPFTRQDFFGVFAAYNTSLWPAQVGLYLLAVVMVVIAARGRVRGTAWPRLGLAFLWAWSGIAYHWVHFTSVNRAAWAFGGLFILEAILLAVTGRGTEDGLVIGPPEGWRGWVGGLLIAGALIVYPWFGLARHPLEQVPVLGVPCPTTIFTFGLLFWAVPPIPRRLLVIPLLWAFFASTAVLFLGVIQDLGLLISGLLGLALLSRRAVGGGVRSRSGPRRPGSPPPHPPPGRPGARAARSGPRRPRRSRARA